MTSPGAIEDGNDLCTLRIVDPPSSRSTSPLSQTSTLVRYFPPRNLSAVLKIRLRIFGNPLRGLDVHQIEVGFFLSAAVVEGGLQEAILQPISVPRSVSW